MSDEKTRTPRKRSPRTTPSTSTPFTTAGSPARAGRRKALKPAPPAQGSDSASGVPETGTRPARPRAKPATPAGSTPAARAPRGRKPAAPPADAGARPARAPQRHASASLSVVMVTPEAHPFAKTGGLAEVASALPDALARLGHAVTVVLPRYRGVAADATRPIDLAVPIGGARQGFRVFEVKQQSGVTAALIDIPELFNREGLYGTAAGDYPDNAWRFAVFSRAALEYMRHRGERPAIIHAHDWQTGLVPVYQKMQLSADSVVGGVPVVFTVHNLAFQGIFPPGVLPQVGLGWDVMHVEAMEYWGQVSYLKGGINFSEKITTVSPTYAREIVRPELGFGFDGVLARRAADLVGIVNGIDVDRWNPAADRYLPVTFDASSLDRKREVKRALLAHAGLPADGEAVARPLVGMVSRLTDQKGLDLFAASAEALMRLDASWVLLGSGERAYEELWRGLAARHPARVAATIGFDERLAHLIEAGADLFLMPSRFEPCGLNQLYSLRYGTVPVVRATGGLDDTVADVDATAGPGTGVKFRDYTPGALVAAVERALQLFGRPETWRAVQRAGMARDVSWDASAREYVKVYRASGRR